MDVYGVYSVIPVALPWPLATMIRKWVRAYQDEDLRASLTALENAIATAEPYADSARRPPQALAHPPTPATVTISEIQFIVLSRPPCSAR